MTTNMEEVPLSPSKLNNNLKSPTLRVRSPSAKSNIAISRGDDDSSIDDDRINKKMCISDETTIKCVFNKKRLFGGSALAIVAVVVIMAVAIATTRSDGSSSSANHMAKVASVGGNSNAAVGTANVESAAPPKVAPVAPVKQSNFAFVAPNSGIGGGSAVERCPGVSGSGKSGKSGSYCSSSGKSGKSGGHGLINLDGSSWYGSGKSGKSGSFPLPTCDAKTGSGKSGKSGYNSFLDAYRVGSDSWYSSGKSGKSGAGYCTLSPENYQDKESTCVDSGAKDINNGCWADPQSIDRVEPIKLDQPICASISKYGDPAGPEQDIDVYKFEVTCPGLHSIIIRATGVTPEGPLYIGTGGLFIPTPATNSGIQPRINPTIYGGADGAECIATGTFTSFVGGGDTLLGAQPIARFEDRQDGVYALTWNLPCGTYYIQMATLLLVRGIIPACDTPGFNCDELGGFLYSIEVSEGQVPCKTILADGLIGPEPEVCATTR